MNILLVEPLFPVPDKSRNHKNFLPIGLLKLASYHRSRGHTVKLARGNKELEFQPEKIMITSLFTYWSEYVWGSVQFYRDLYPDAEIVVGGIYASLMPEHCKLSGCDRVFTGVHKSAEKYPPAYDLVKVDYQIIHTSRGCVRQCTFCGARQIEPEFTFKKSIRKEIRKKKLVFYDNNLLANPFVKDILLELVELRKEKKVALCESQCGFDGRMLTPELAQLLKQAGFQYPKIAWDGPYSQHQEIKRQIDMLVDARFDHRDLSIFMLYNWELPFEEMERKRLKCWEWKVQISDCRFRPLDRISDCYLPRLKQTSEDYYIHPGWTDAKVKQFRRNVRRQNICIRMQVEFYSDLLATGRLEKNGYLGKDLRPSDAWDPSRITPPKVDILSANSNYLYNVHQPYN